MARELNNRKLDDRMTRINSTNLFGPTQYLVDPSGAQGAFTTIQSALDALNAAGNFGTVYIKPGAYLENLIMYPNQQICGVTAEGRVNQDCPVRITGTHSLIGDGVGNFGATVVQGIAFDAFADTFTITNNGPNGLVFAAKFCQIISAIGSGFIVDKVGAGIFALAVTFECQVDVAVDGFQINGVGCQGLCTLSDVNANNIVANIIGAGAAFHGQRSQLNGSVETIHVGTATSSCVLDWCRLQSNGPTVNFAAAGTVTAKHCAHQTSVGGGNYIAGAAGTYTYGADVLDGASVNIASGITQNLLVTRLGSSLLVMKSIVFADSPYTTVASDQFISVDTSGGAVTVRLPNVPDTGRVYTIKDSTGSAAANNISVTTVGGVVNIDGAATLLMNSNYQAVSVIFDGTAYEVF